jgi:hypothetical protein
MSDYRGKLYYGDMYLGELTKAEVRALRDYLNDVLGETEAEMTRLRNALFPEGMNLPRCLLHDVIDQRVAKKMEQFEEDEGDDW